MARRRRLLALLCLLAAACGKEEGDGKKPVEGVVRFPERSKDPVVASLQEFAEGKAIDRSSPRWKISLPKPPKATFAPGSRYFWRLQTNRGPLRIRLMPDVAPMHVTSTIYLTVIGFYDGLTFHRVIEGFMAQGGDPLGNGKGMPGYGFDGEIRRDVRHDRRGLLSTANMNRPGTDGSQIFLTFAPTPGLDGKHTIFGEVVEGSDTLAAIERLAGTPQFDGSAPPRGPIVIEKATIEVE